MDENVNKIGTSGLNNVLSGVGIFILGMPVFYGALVYQVYGGVNILLLAILVVTYGIAGYVLGKIKPNLKWKSGLILTLGLVLTTVIVATIYLRLIDFYIETSRNLILTLLAFLGVMMIVNILSSRWGAHSRKTWEGSVSNIIFIIFVLISVFGIGAFIVAGPLIP